MADRNVPILKQLDTLRRRARWGLALRGGLVTLLLISTWLTFLGVLDFWLRPESGVVRWTLFALFWCGAGFAVRQFLIRPLLQKTSLTEVALWLEESHPEWRGEFAAVVDFAQKSQHNSTGSADRNTQLTHTLAQRFDSIRLSSERTSRMSLGWGLLLSLLITISVAIISHWPNVTSLAMARVALPDQNFHWPQRTRLELLGQDFETLPELVLLPKHANGEDEFYIIDRIDSPPDRVQFEIKTSSAKTITQTLKPIRRKFPDGSLQQVFLAKLPEESAEVMRIRARGDDDNMMPWRTVAIASPPVISDLKIVQLPPAYLELPETELPVLTSSLTVLAGSTLRISGRIDRQVRSLSLHWNGDSLQSLPVKVDSAGEFEVVTGLPERLSETLELQLVAEPILPEGTNSPHSAQAIRRIPFHILQDESPSVTLDVTAEEIQLTDNALLKLQAVASDDFSVDQLSVECRHEGTQKLLSEVHHSSPAREVSLPFQLDMTQFSVSTGDTLVLTAKVIDTFPERVPVLSRSLRIQIVDPEFQRQQIQISLQRLADSLREMQSRELEILRRAVQLQSIISLPTPQRGDQIQLLARSLVTEQQELGAGFEQNQDSLSQQSLGILETLRMNRIPADSIERLLRMVADEAKSLAKFGEQNIEGNLTQVCRTLQLADASIWERRPEELIDKDMQEVVSAAEQMHRRLQTLSELIAQQSQSDQWRDSWRKMLAEVTTLIETTQHLGTPLISRSPDELTFRQHNNMAHLAEEHRRVAQLALSQSSHQPITGSSSHNDEQVRTLLEVQQRLESAGEHVRQNQITQALSLDQQAEKLLQSLDRNFIQASQKVSEFEVSAILEQTGLWFAQARRRQQGILSDHETAFQVTNPDKRRAMLSQTTTMQSELGNQSAAWALQLKFTSAHSLAVLLQSVSQKMRELQHLLLSQNPVELQATTEEVLELIQQAERELKHLQGEIAQQQQLQSALILGERLLLLAERQLQLSRDLSAKFDQQQEKKILSRSERLQLLELTGTQVAIGKELEDIHSALSYQPALQLALTLQVEAISEITQGLQAFHVSDKFVSQQQAIASELHWLGDLLTQTALPESLSSQDQSNPAAAQSSMRSSEFQILIKMQSDLILEEEALLKESESADPERSLQLSHLQQRLSQLLEDFWSHD